MADIRRTLVRKNLNEVHEYPNNPRKNAEAVADVAESIRQCGYVAPIIVDEAGVILAGHTWYKAMQRLGWAEAEVQVVEGLTEEQKRKFRILDNKAGEKSEWAEDLLKAELADLDFGDYDFDFGVDDEEEEEKEEEKPEVEFTEELQEENNYIVLVFRTDVDWLQAQTLLDIKTVKGLDDKPNYPRRGIGRVLDGPTAIEKLTGAGKI